MRQLVLYAGTRMTGWAQMHKHLVASRADLARSGVVIPPGASLHDWHSATVRCLQDSDAGGKRPWGSQRRGTSTLLLGSDLAEDMISQRAGLPGLRAVAAQYRARPRVVVVVRDQLSYLNRVYCAHVLNLDTAADFTHFVANHVSDRRFDYEAQFAAAINAPGVDFLAVPYSGVDPKRPASALLDAVGVGGAALGDAPVAESEPLPGPTLIAATRLLHKRFRRRDAFRAQGRGELRRVAHALRDHAGEQGWDSDAFWGWTPDLADRAIDRYQGSNDSFARRVWGSPWPEAWPHHPERVVSLSHAEPATVADVVDTVQRLLADVHGDT